MLLTMEDLDILVKGKLSEKRYKHTLAVTKLSLELAEHYKISLDETLNAAMLHDITKEESLSSQLQTIAKSDIMNDTVLEKSSNIYHSITAYLYAKDRLDIKNIDVLNAIRYHTTGRKNMSMLEKIIFTADTVSYDRTYDEAKKLRELSFKDIDACMINITRFIISDLINKGAVIDSNTIDCYNTIAILKS
ncbi:MAG: bis(5'-nucleosyl)-tetraphosphatase (symmetrical) YqeK [Oscillospiraceae bacterium]